MTYINILKIAVQGTKLTDPKWSRFTKSRKLMNKIFHNIYDNMVKILEDSNLVSLEPIFSRTWSKLSP